MLGKDKNGRSAVPPSCLPRDAKTYSLPRNLLVFGQNCGLCDDHRHNGKHAKFKQANVHLWNCIVSASRYAYVRRYYLCNTQ